jgi:glyoxylate reductase
MSKTVFFTRRIPEVAIKMLEEKGCQVEVNPESEVPSHQRIIELVAQKPYDAVVTLLTDQIDAEVFDAAPHVGLFANYATGYDNIDVKVAQDRGIVVTNAPADATSESVAEHTMALILGLAARIVESDESIRRGQYKGWDPMNFIGFDIRGKTLGLIGAGRIGERVGRQASELGMNIIYFDRGQNDSLESLGAKRVESIEELLPEADVVSIHVPLNDSTRHLINSERLRMMRPSAILVNTSRGPVVSEAALEAELKAGTIAGAGLDVFEFEPNISPGLIELQNVILTPHIASASREAREEMAVIVASNVIDFFEGRAPRNQILQ